MPLIAKIRIMLLVIGFVISCLFLVHRLWPRSKFWPKFFREKGEKRELWNDQMQSELLTRRGVRAENSRIN